MAQAQTVKQLINDTETELEHLKRHLAETEHTFLVNHEKAKEKAINIVNATYEKVQSDATAVRRQGIDTQVCTNELNLEITKALTYFLKHLQECYNQYTLRYPEMNAALGNQTKEGAKLKGELDEIFDKNKNKVKKPYPGVRDLRVAVKSWKMYIMMLKKYESSDTANAKKNLGRCRKSLLKYLKQQSKYHEREATHCIKNLTEKPELVAASTVSNVDNLSTLQTKAESLKKHMDTVKNNLRNYKLELIKAEKGLHTIYEKKREMASNEIETRVRALTNGNKTALQRRKNASECISAFSNTAKRIMVNRVGQMDQCFQLYIAQYDQLKDYYKNLTKEGYGLYEKYNGIRKNIEINEVMQVYRNVHELKNLIESWEADINLLKTYEKEDNAVAKKNIQHCTSSLSGAMKRQFDKLTINAWQCIKSLPTTETPVKPLITVTESAEAVKSNSEATTVPGLHQTVKPATESALQPSTIVTGLDEKVKPNTEVATQPPPSVTGLDETVKLTTEAATQPPTTVIGLGETVKPPTEAVTQSPTTVIELDETVKSTTEAATQAPTTVTGLDATAKPTTEAVTQSPTTVIELDEIVKSTTEAVTQAPTTVPGLDETAKSTTDAATQAPTTAATQAPTTVPGLDETVKSTTEAVTQSPTTVIELDETVKSTTEAATEAPTTVTGLDETVKPTTEAGTQAPTTVTRLDETASPNN
ncbi:uncharacterized protein [Fopius arisanus]|uniref:Uncharacterized protein n=1 Tax=Fopius arisanus TaxID=64838 RepID=A0A9R1T2C9_9HYME|nr:PREDICTED: uncharacterized protein LOC105265559 [Fopius arisanus]